MNIYDETACTEGGGNWNPMQYECVVPVNSADDCLDQCLGDGSVQYVLSDFAVYSLALPSTQLLTLALVAPDALLQACGKELVYEAGG